MQDNKDMVSEDQEQLVHPKHWLLNNGIRRYRISRSMSQYDLQDETHITQRQLSSYELGEVSPPLEHLRLIAKALDCSVPDLTETDSRAYAHRRSGRKSLKGRHRGKVQRGPCQI